MSTAPVTATVADFVSIGSGREARSSHVPEVDESSALVVAARTGDRAAFGRLVELHGAPALRTALAALGRREDAELRACAAMALGRIGSQAATNALRQAQGEKDVVVRNSVNRALRAGAA